MSSPGRVELEPAFVLHVRPWRETSQIAEVFSHAHGRMGLVARGARRPKSALRGLLNPFQRLRLSWSGRGELATLRDAELIGPVNQLANDRVMVAFYVNELMLRLLERADPHPLLFARYSAFLSALAIENEYEALLRYFELELLQELGYALNLQTDAYSDDALRPQQLYEFRVDQGAFAVTSTQQGAICFTGAELLAIGSGEFSTPAELLAAKRLLRAALNFHLGQRGLQTRRVAAAMKR